MPIDHRPPLRLRYLPVQQRNYILCRERGTPEIPWVRPAELAYLPPLRGPVVVVNGAFDLLHSGHMRLIFAARHKASTLVCLLDTDEKIARTKGKDRPCLNFIERANALSYMPIDMIIPINTQNELKQTIKTLNPTWHFIGEEYRNTHRIAGTARVFVRMGSLHTTSIVERIKNA